MKHTKTFRPLYISSICLALLHLAFWFLDARMYNPSWGDLLGRCFALWFLLEFKNRQWWFGALLAIDVAIGPLMFYGFGIPKVRSLHLLLALCWALMGVFYFKINSEGGKDPLDDKEAVG